MKSFIPCIENKIKIKTIVLFFKKDNLSFIFKTFVITILLASRAQAELTSFNLTSKIDSTVVRWWDEDGVIEYYKSIGGINKTLLMTEKVVRKQDYTSCISLTSNLIESDDPKISLIKPWIINKQLFCALKVLDSTKFSKNTDASWFVQIMNNIEDTYLNFGTYTNSLRKLWIQANIKLLDLYITSEDKQASEILSTLFDKKNYWKGNNKIEARIYTLASDLSFLLKDIPSSIAYLHRSLKSEDTAEARLKLSQREKLHKPVAQLEEEQDIVTTSVSTVSEEEKELVQKLSNIKNDPLNFIGLFFELIKLAPGSYNISWSSKKAIDMYVALFKSAENEVLKQDLKTLILENINISTRDFIMKLASRLYWSLLYDEAYNLLKSLFEKNELHHDELLFQYARAAYSTSNNTKAKEVYDTLIKEHSASKHIPEAMYRSGLISIKLKDYLSAVDTFDKLLLRSDIQSVELNAMYWLWVSLIQLEKKSRADILSKKIISEYPLTYYSMKIRAYYNQDTIEAFIPDNLDISIKVLLTRAEKKVFDSLHYLLQIGWLDEAQEEIRAIADFNNPRIMIVLAKYWFMAGNFLEATKILQKAWNIDNSLVNTSVIRFTYPNEFSNTINKYISKYQYTFNTDVVLSIIRQESLFQTDAVSSAGAMGLMQLTHETMLESAKLLKVKVDRRNPEQNIMLGMSYFNRMLKAFDYDLAQALAAYNAGIGRYRTWLKASKIMPKPSVELIDEVWIEDLPYSETRFYVKAILRTILIYRLLNDGSVNIKKSFWKL